MNTQGEKPMKFFDPSTIMFLFGFIAIIAGGVLYLRAESTEYKRVADGVKSIMATNEKLMSNWEAAVKACETVVAETDGHKQLLEQYRQRLEKIEFAVQTPSKLSGTMNLVAHQPIAVSIQPVDVRVLKKQIIDKNTPLEPAKPMTDAAVKKNVIKKIKKQMNELSQ